MFQWFKNIIGQRAVTYSTGVSCGLIPSPSYSGMPVTEQTALGVSSIWCGVRVISEAVGSLPILLYQDKPSGAEIAKSHPLYRLLKDEPNAEVTRPVLWETAQAHCLLYGNAFLEIERDNSGRPIALWNVHPTRVQVARDSETGKLVYRISLSTSGGPPGNPGSQTVLPAEDVLHVPGLSPDGSVGYRLLTIARETIGFGLGAQRFGCSLFRNLGRPGGVIDAPLGVKLDDNGRNNLRKSFQAEHAGENVGTVALMEQGFKFTPLTMPTNEQTQYKDILQFFVYEVARLLNCPPSKLHSLEKATWGNLETLNQDFCDTTLRPWLEKWEAELEKKLLLPSEKGKYCIEFDTSELLKANQLARYQAYQLGIQSGFLEANEVRGWENLPPIEVPKPQPTQPKTKQVPQEPPQGETNADV